MHALPHRLDARRETLDKIMAGGPAREQQVHLLRDLCNTMLGGSLCALGGMAPYPVLSALNHFPQDFGLAASPAPPPARPDAARPETAMLETVIKRDRDLGTPARKSAQTVTLTIDGQEITVPEGSSLMRAAAEAGINIPKLCATDSLEPFGSCRLCLVQIDGRRGYPASCTTPAEHGMVVHTETPKLRELRRGVMELYISDHPLDCLTCPANGDCELQDMAGVVGLREVRYGYQGANHLDSAKDESNPYFTYDPSKRIVCNRCVRACEETQGTYALTISGKGFESRVSPGQDQPFLDSECVSCGACVQACPTSTLQEKTVIMMGQAEHSVVTTCAYCGVGCGFKAEMKGQEVVRMVPWKDGQANRGHSCVKGRFAWGYATHKERVLKPMIRQRITDPWREVSWDEAINHAASEFRRIQARHGRDAVGGITSSRCTNEETWLVQKLVRARLRHQQRRHLRPRSPLAHRLRPEADAGRIGRHPDLRFGHAHRRGDRDGRQPQQRPPGVRLAPEAPAAPGRAPDRDRSAPHRAGQLAAHQGRLPPAGAARHQHGAAVLAGARHRHRKPYRRSLRRRTLRGKGVPGMARLRLAARELARGDGRNHRRAGPRRAARRGSTPPAATARSITAWASPSTARDRPP